MHLNALLRVSSDNRFRCWEGGRAYLQRQAAYLGSGMTRESIDFHLSQYGDFPPGHHVCVVGAHPGVNSTAPGIHLTTGAASWAGEGRGASGVARQSAGRGFQLGRDRAAAAESVTSALPLLQHAAAALFQLCGESCVNGRQRGQGWSQRSPQHACLLRACCVINYWHFIARHYCWIVTCTLDGRIFVRSVNYRCC